MEVFQALLGLALATTEASTTLLCSPLVVLAKMACWVLRLVSPGWASLVQVALVVVAYGLRQLAASSLGQQASSLLMAAMAAMLSYLRARQG
jgi:hypothetical protein